MEQDQPIYEVLAIRYGTRLTSKSESYLNYHLYDEPDATIRMDYFFWVARSATRTVVIDCGFDPVVGEHRGRQLLVAPCDALLQLDIDPGRVADLIVTHGHYDHIGNLHRFPLASVVVSRRELDLWAGPYGSRRQLAAPTERAELDHLARAEKEGRVVAIKGQYTVAPGIDAVEVGGHTPGQLVVLVATPAGRAVLASDAVHFYEELERDRPFSVVSDVEEMYRSFDYLREIVSAPGHSLVAGHDPEVMGRFSPVAGALAGSAVRIP